MIAYPDAKRAAEKHFDCRNIILTSSEIENAWLFGTRMTLPNGHVMSVPGAGLYAIRKDTGEEIRISGTGYVDAKRNGDRDGYGKWLAARFGMTFHEFVDAMDNAPEYDIA